MGSVDTGVGEDATLDATNDSTFDSSTADAAARDSMDEHSGESDSSMADVAPAESGVADSSGADSEMLEDSAADGSDANSGDGGPILWTIYYTGSNDLYGTKFFLTAPADDPQGLFTSTCYAMDQTATLTASGADYVVTPMAGCYEQQIDPCIFCGPGSGLGYCPSGTSVLLTSTGAPLTWQGTCGEYTVILQGQ